MLWRDLKAWQIYGANTDVGKTVVSTILCKALQRRAPNHSLLYLKPVSTGPPDEADDKHISRHASGVISKCISQFSKPVSPHIAAQLDSGSGSIPTSNKSILTKVKRVLNEHVEDGGRFALLETAGGVLSPGPSGSVQADIYRPLRLPTLLIGDSKLGGIATTISAFESLRLRGYDLDSVLVFDDPKWGNHAFLREYFSKHDIKTCALPLPPPRQQNPQEDEILLAEYYDHCSSSTPVADLVEMLNQKHFSRVSKLTSLPAHTESIIWHPFRQHALPQNIIAIDSAYDDHFQAYNQEADPSVANQSRKGSSGLTAISSSQRSQQLLTPLFDASASWWTQGLGHGNPDLSLTAAYAAGRYGHVMFANAVHEPALDLSYNLLSTLQNPRLSRVFFTDNGSTGMEVAVKMALRAACQRYGWQKDDGGSPVGILGLKGSYHGDTIGVMNCSEPSVFNQKVDWYKPWGHWFDPPQLLMRKGKWELEVPESMQESPSQKKVLLFDSLDAIFDFPSRSADEAFYKTFITRTVTELVETQNARFGALILEPLLMGAGGMIFVDPLFQRTLITTIRENPALISPHHSSQQTVPTATSPHNGEKDTTNWTGLPVIADEVFTGLYRLGRASSSSFLSSSSSATNSKTIITPDIAPDISVHAKLLTGGLLPLALTTASDAIFNVFLSDSKTDALLHGHSYTAHPIGCAVANKSLDELNRMNVGQEWEGYRSAWGGASSSPSSSSSSSSSIVPSTPSSSNTGGKMFSFFSPTTLSTLSHHPRVSGCFALGTVLAITLRSPPSSVGGGGGGYNSTAAATLQSRLLTTLDADGAGVHSRVLGDVLYLMTSLTTRPEQVGRLERSLLEALDAED